MTQTPEVLASGRGLLAAILLGYWQEGLESADVNLGRSRFTIRQLPSPLVPSIDTDHMQSSSTYILCGGHDRSWSVTFGGPAPVRTGGPTIRTIASDGSVVVRDLSLTGDLFRPFACRASSPVVTLALPAVGGIGFGAAARVLYCLHRAGVRLPSTPRLSVDDRHALAQLLEALDCRVKAGCGPVYARIVGRLDSRRSSCSYTALHASDSFWASSAFVSAARSGAVPVGTPVHNFDSVERLIRAVSFLASLHLRDCCRQVLCGRCDRTVDDSRSALCIPRVAYDGDTELSVSCPSYLRFLARKEEADDEFSAVVFPGLRVRGDRNNTTQPNGPLALVELLFASCAAALNPLLPQQ